MASFYSCVSDIGICAGDGSARCGNANVRRPVLQSQRTPIFSIISLIAAICRSRSCGVISRIFIIFFGFSSVCCGSPHFCARFRAQRSVRSRLGHAHPRALITLYTTMQVYFLKDAERRIARAQKTAFPQTEARGNAIFFVRTFRARVSRHRAANRGARQRSGHAFRAVPFRKTRERPARLCGANRRRSSQSSCGA